MIKRWLKQRRQARELRAALARGYDIRPTYVIPPEHNPGIRGVPTKHVS